MEIKLLNDNKELEILMYEAVLEELLHIYQTATQNFNEVSFRHGKKGRAIKKIKQEREIEISELQELIMQVEMKLAELNCKSLDTVLTLSYLHYEDAIV